MPDPTEVCANNCCGVPNCDIEQRLLEYPAIGIGPRDHQLQFALPGTPKPRRLLWERLLSYARFSHSFRTNVYTPPTFTCSLLEKKHPSNFILGRRSVEHKGRVLKVGDVRRGKSFSILRAGWGELDIRDVLTWVDELISTLGV